MQTLRAKVEIKNCKKSYTNAKNCAKILLVQYLNAKDEAERENVITNFRNLCGEDTEFANKCFKTLQQLQANFFTAIKESTGEAFATEFNKLVINYESKSRNS